MTPKDWKQKYYYPTYRFFRFFRSIWWFFRYDIHQGIGNLVRWFPIIWHDRDWDQNYLLRIMEKKFRRMSELQENHGNSLHAPRYARQLKIAAHLCHRMIEDDYYENAKFYGYPSRAWAKEVSAVEKQDKEMLGKLIGKYIDHWWD